MPEVLDRPKPLSTAGFYHLIRQQIDNEDSLMNQRVNWLIFSQSFFFSGYATLISSPPQPENGIYTQVHSSLLWIIPCISMTTSLFIYAAILISLIYMADLRKYFETYPQDDTTEHFPPIQSTTVVRRLAQLPPVVIPILFISTWIILLAQQLR